MSNAHLYLGIKSLIAQPGLLQIEGLTLDPQKPEEELKLLQGVLNEGAKAALTLPALPKLGTRTVSEVIDEYCDEQVRIGQWTDKTAKENRAIYNTFLAIVGNGEFCRLGYDELRAYKKQLLKLPPNLNKDTKLKELPIGEVLSQTHPKLLSRNTANKNFIRVSSLFKWALKHGYTDKNYAGGLTLPKDKRPSEERNVFTDDDIAKLFGSLAFQQGKYKHAHRYWVPLIALYSGARIEEICQLEVTDIREEDGIWVIDINDEGDKKLKTSASRRVIPVHPRLIELGLPRYVATLVAKGEKRVFPELHRTAGNYSHDVSKWFGRYKKQQGITDERKTFHSFRHTVIDRLHQSPEAQPRHIELLAGHADGRVNSGRYAKPLRPLLLKPTLERLSYASENSTAWK